jgi:hypothetical protein
MFGTLRKKIVAYAVLSLIVILVGIFTYIYVCERVIDPRISATSAVSDFLTRNGYCKYFENLEVSYRYSWPCSPPLHGPTPNLNLSTY